MILNLAVFLCTLTAMEAIGYLAHRYIMHDWGWFLHRSHHEPHLGVLETNDIYLLALALIAFALVAVGRAGHAPLQWVGAGVAAFGVIYVIVHDGIVHRHWPFKPLPRNRYLKRLYKAHLLHHALKGRDNSVSFGFLYAPPMHRLKRQLRKRRSAVHDYPAL